MFESEGKCFFQASYEKKFKLSDLCYSAYFIGPMPKFTISEVKKKSSLQKPIDLTGEDEIIQKAKANRKQEQLKTKRDLGKFMSLFSFFLPINCYNNFYSHLFNTQ